MVLIDLIFIIKWNYRISRKIQRTLSLSFNITIMQIIFKSDIENQDEKVLTWFNSLDIRLNEGLLWTRFGTIKSVLDRRFCPELTQLVTREDFIELSPIKTSSQIRFGAFRFHANKWFSSSAKPVSETKEGTAHWNKFMCFPYKLKSNSAEG
jgi:hypothetical protein